MDHNASASGRTRIEARYSLYDVGSANARGVGGLNDVSRGTRLDDTDQTAAVSVLSALSSALYNEARAQVTRSRLGAPVNDSVGPAVTVSGSKVLRPRGAGSSETVTRASRIERLILSEDASNAATGSGARRMPSCELAAASTLADSTVTSRP
jgi:hypothetical protein